ncbi:hypothetical protein JQ633_21185 [Bradyrhizobium tropiciagri]|uniref:hypothetical protein n=1 Tax=Bradyrhizobium tropiciagri TaxID=312253 RepID=UPI001BA74634|nr:hypothetical protein [Bradyrhizobium tropiciagri]MBR0872889.1 hypothetical protein [Bradyrhizobium tropiciagri]
MQHAPPRKRACWCFFVRRILRARQCADPAFAIEVAAADAVLHKRSSAWLKNQPDMRAPGHQSDFAAADNVLVFLLNFFCANWHAF